MNIKEARKKFVSWTKDELTGANILVNSTINDDNNSVKPLDRIFTGFLFPILESQTGFEDDDTEEEDSEVTSDNNSKNEVKPATRRKRYLPPSSSGFSFFIKGEQIKLRVFHNAKFYENKSEERERDTKQFQEQKWEKGEFYDEGREIEFILNGVTQYEIFDGKAKIDALWRPYKDGYIVTLTISNMQKIKYENDPIKYNIMQNEKTLFEVEFKCIVEEGDIDIYPTTDRELLNEEEKEIELRYKDIHIYAVGHGTAVNWTKNEFNQMELWTDFIPVVEVPHVTADTGNNSKVLMFNFLQDSNPNEVISELESFVNDYESWIEGQNSSINNEDDIETARKIVARQKTAKSRMRDGVNLLKIDREVRLAFGIANEAMLMQMESTDKNKGRLKERNQYKWRPFQLAFILMVLESSANEDSNFRDVLDLIWFPTGGGKTEAYLGLMAFLIIYRRLRYPTSYGGTVAIMRYTLRLLTAQQFIRASKVISALEIIRRRDVKKYGEEPISLGLWVGGASTPNNFNQTKDIIEEGKFSKLILNSCPWCNAPFSKENYVLTENDFHYRCTNKKCEFGKNEDNILPFNVIDEALYQKPPTLLIATVDKFARLAWEERASTFFGGNKYRAPELIIQDELHLISSALGSIVGLYEVAIDTILKSKGIYAKYIASTATIKNASEQIKTLFAREMLIFPPPGLRYDDSYFARTIPLDKKPGRMYVGYLAPLLSRQNCLAPLSSVILSAPQKLFKDEQKFLDSWWTQIIYHGSLKGVGNSRTLFQGEVKNRLEELTFKNLKEEVDEISPHFTSKSGIKYLKDFEDARKKADEEIINEIDKFLPMREINVKMLSSNQSASENAKVFEQLKRERNSKDSIDVSLATNMISVGLDVERLALMIINGQPLTTAEYIQASSRVGRGATPGIVFINYYKTQARSLSHYENFRSYHDSFYRFVEPSSLTPYTYQARMRALHAVLVIVIRYNNIGLLENESARNFNPNNEQAKKIIKAIKKRCKSAIVNNQELIEKTSKQIDDLIYQWSNEIEHLKRLNNGRDANLQYSQQGKDRGPSNLLCDFDIKNGLWPTLNSMRNVEKTALVKLLGGLKRYGKI